MSIIVFLALLILDLWSKEWAEKTLIKPKILFNGKMEFYYVRNYGIAFNKLSGKVNMILALNIALFGFLIYQMAIDRSNAVFYSVVLAGGMGNFVNRVRKGYVVDFIYFNIKKWPVFNVADFEIFIGVGVLVIRELFR